MGNNHSNGNPTSQFGNLCGTRPLDRLKVRKMNPNPTKRDDAFIINYHHNNKMKESVLSADALDPRRLVFVSLVGFYQTWRRVPSVLLYSSLLMMPLKREWILHPSDHISELQDNICSPCFCDDVTQITDFIRLLQWKVSQKLIIFILDDLELDEHTRILQHFVPNPLVAPFWYRVSATLTSLYDHMEGTKYKPISFDEEFWGNRTTFCTKNNTKTKSILCELYFVTMRHDTMQEIIYQSNPKTLRPVVAYGYAYSKLDHVVQCNETRFGHCTSQLPPIIEETDDISDIDPIQIHVDGVTPISQEMPCFTWSN
eukprot:43577_1